MTTLKEGFAVLVADDSPMYRKLVERTLSPKQYTVLLACSGGEALNLFVEHQPALVITDWLMPDLSGIELCKRIRTDFRTAYTYIILLTGIADKTKVVKGLEAGADDYLTKPFHPDELLARVGVGRRMIELHREIEEKNRLLEQTALTDALTGLPNRRAIDDWATRQLSGAARYDFPFWVVMADIDHFKSVNDTYGHDAGDTVLKEFAEILKRNTRQCDICGRIGGEEFLLVLAHAVEEDVHIVTERIRHQLEEHQFALGGQKARVTASFGIAGFRGAKAPDFSRLVTKADAALYSAKRGGRNRIEFAVTAL